MPHGVESAEVMEDAIQKVHVQRIGYIFVTDDVIPNPWDRLPIYWDQLVDAVEKVNVALLNGRPVIEEGNRHN